MKKVFLTGVVIFSFQLLQAQSGKATGEMLTQKHNDSIILADIIKPLLEQSATTPDWNALGVTIKEKYGESYVERSVTKAKIYYYYDNDWPLFCKALVQYTETYEDKDDLRLMNKNAKMVLQHSQVPEESKSAMVWIKHAMEKEPGNPMYKETYDALSTKLKSQMLTEGN